MRWWIILALCLTIGAYSAWAQDEAIRITYGETLSGSLDDDHYRQLYVFNGRQGEIVTISMITTEGDLDPYISLVDSTGRGVAFSDDDGDGKAALLDSLHLPITGDYFLIATRFGHEQGSTSGNYQLSLTRLGSTTPAGATIRYGDNIIGEIKPDSPQVVYIFQGQRGDVINLRMKRTSGNLDPFIDLANSQGQILLSGDDDPNEPGTLNAAILNFTIQTSDYYLIVASRYGREAGETQGSFLLSLESIPIEQRGFSPPTAILIDYGASITGSISGDLPQRFYTFEGRRGDVISLQMQRIRGNLNPYLMVLNNDLDELGRAGGVSPYDRARIPALTLPQDGRYYIMATRDKFSEGQTSGDFSLTLNGREGISGGDYLEIFYDTEITGVINNILPYENFIFQGKADDIVTIRMTATSGNLDSLLTLYQGDKQIVFDDDSGGNKNAAIIGFRLPEDGLYRIEASRFNREAGTTEGNYTLRLEVR
jgi:hypothetical protein